MLTTGINSTHKFKTRYSKNAQDILNPWTHGSKMLNLLQVLQLETRSNATCITIM